MTALWSCLDCGARAYIDGMARKDATPYIPAIIAAHVCQPQIDLGTPVKPRAGEPLDLLDLLTEGASSA